MPLIDFPNSPATGDTFTDSGKTWKYTGYAWTVITIPTAVVNGSITLAQIDTSGAAIDQVVAYDGSQYAPSSLIRDSYIRLSMEVL